MRLTRREFEALVAEALESLPPAIAEAIENVAVVVAPETTYHHRLASGTRVGTLLGLYEGVPLTKRGSGYSLVPPDVITLFQGPICRRARNRDEIRQLVRDTVIHEIAHHFGIDEAELEARGLG